MNLTKLIDDLLLEAGRINKDKYRNRLKIMIIAHEVLREYEKIPHYR